MYIFMYLRSYEKFKKIILIFISVMKFLCKKKKKIDSDKSLPTFFMNSKVFSVHIFQLILGDFFENH